MPKKRRTPNRGWQIYADRVYADRAEHSGPAANYGSYQDPNPNPPLTQVHPDTVVDELFIGDWLHLEAMSGRSYWMVVGGVTLEVFLRKDGTVKKVAVYGPGDFAEATPGVTYTMVWRRPA